MRLMNRILLYLWYWKRFFVVGRVFLNIKILLYDMMYATVSILFGSSANVFEIAVRSSLVPKLYASQEWIHSIFIKNGYCLFQK